MDWEEGCGVHSWGVVVMEAHFYLQASREAALSPFCYCSDQLDSAQTPALWHSDHMSPISTLYCCHNLLVHSAPLGPTDWLAVWSSGVVSLSIEFDMVQTATGSFTTELRKFLLINLLNNSFTFALSCCCFICTIWWNTVEICRENNLWFVRAVCHLFWNVFSSTLIIQPLLYLFNWPTVVFSTLWDYIG